MNNNQEKKPITKTHQEWDEAVAALKRSKFQKKDIKKRNYDINKVQSSGRTFR